jgi:hypothetical protein
VCPANNGGAFCFSPYKMVQYKMDVMDNKSDDPMVMRPNVLKRFSVFLFWLCLYSAVALSIEIARFGVVELMSSAFMISFVFMFAAIVASSIMLRYGLSPMVMAIQNKDRLPHSLGALSIGVMLGVFCIVGYLYMMFEHHDLWVFVVITWGVNLIALVMIWHDRKCKVSKKRSVVLPCDGDL